MDSAGRVSSFQHLIAFYEGEDGFVERALPFVREGIARDEPVRVMTSADKCARLATELDGEAEAVEFLDMTAIGRNPACIIPAWAQFVERHAGKRTRGVGEPVWPQRAAAELEECEHHESLLNLAFADGPGMRLLCPYDTTALDPEVLERARRSHPVVADNGSVAPNPDYVPFEQGPGPFAGDLPSPPAGAGERGFGPDDLADLRRFVFGWARRAGHDRGRAEDVTLAVHELATNSVRHGGGAGTLRAWTERRAVCCEVRDEGSIADPLTGRRRPSPTQPDGRGIWVVNHLCDLVQIRSLPGGGTIIRIRLER